MHSIKTKFIGLSLLSSILSIGVSAQQNRTVGDFNGIKAGDAFNISIMQSENQSVKVDAPENVQNQIKTEVKDGILVISTEGNIKTDEDIKITVAMKTLNSLDISGAADVKSESQMNVDKLTIKTNGAGDIHLDVKRSEEHTSELQSRFGISYD